VIRHDLRKRLPFPDAGFDAVYSSHVLEHLAPEHGEALIGEMHRVLAPGGVVRVVVPDLEGICREYLTRLEAALEDGGEAELSRYRWIVLELLDQMVRERPGGHMLATLQDRAFDPEYVRMRCGEEFAPLLSPGSSRGGAPSFGLAARARAALGRLRSAIDRRSARRTGELHRWMYDRLSLRLLLESAGFVDVARRGFDESAIRGWERYRLDAAADGSGPRKPDSLFVEASRPA
jgi:SAM-dependent methyltransferase